MCKTRMLPVVFRKARTGCSFKLNRYVWHLPCMHHTYGIWRQRTRMSQTSDVCWAPQALLAFSSTKLGLDQCVQAFLHGLGTPMGPALSCPLSSEGQLVLLPCFLLLLHWHHLLPRVPQADFLQQHECNWQERDVGSAGHSRAQFRV